MYNQLYYANASSATSSDSSTSTTGLSVTVGAGLGAIAGSIIAPGVGTVVGAGIGGILGGIIDAIFFDTGGYTGAWDGTEGKFAVLHQKELVLNQDDTENILSAVDAVREIGDVDSAITSAVDDSIADWAALSDIAAAQTLDAATDTIEQQVTIEATFPNVTSSSKIEDAFNNLVNIAA